MLMASAVCAAKKAPSSPLYPSLRVLRGRQTLKRSALFASSHTPERSLAAPRLGPMAAAARRAALPGAGRSLRARAPGRRAPCGRRVAAYAPAQEDAHEEVRCSRRAAPPALRGA